MRERTNQDYSSASFIWGGNLKLIGGSIALTVYRVMLLPFAVVRYQKKVWNGRFNSSYIIPATIKFILVPFYLICSLINENLVNCNEVEIDDLMLIEPLCIYYSTLIYAVIWLWKAAFFFSNIFPEAVYFYARILR